MQEVILIKNGELALKGLNRHSFEDAMIKNIRHALKGMGRAEVRKSQSTMTVSTAEDADFEEALKRVSRVFGIAKLSRACKCEKKLETILETAAEYLEPQLSCARTFKVEAKRSDKTFPLRSPQICEEAGAFLLEKYPNLSVDVHNPEVTVRIEVRDECTFIHANPIEGAGGLPVGTSGKAAVMISGGIDSPVAAWMIAKRGVELCAVHFASPPYTSERAEQKVRDLLGKVSLWSGAIKLYIVPFSEIQENIRDYCPEEFFTVIMRRVMIKITERIAQGCGCSAMVSGESVGQVASQTLKAIYCTDRAATMPILRPLIGMDKEEIIRIARRIDTFETSILPFEDCCTVFTPKHPRTKPELDKVLAAEQALDICDKIELAIQGSKVVWIAPSAVM